MPTKVGFQDIFNSIAGIKETELLATQPVKADLFSDSRQTQLLSFLQASNLLQHIHPIPATLSTKLEFNIIDTPPESIAYEYLNTSYGELFVASTAIGVCYISFKQDTNLSDLEKHFPKSAIHPEVKDLHQIAKAHIESDTSSALSLHLKATDFQLKVWKELYKIPKGQLSTYKYIAASLNKYEASIAVGAAVGKNPIALLLPCHRVIRSNGEWRSYRWGNANKAALLIYELA